MAEKKTVQQQAQERIEKLKTAQEEQRQKRKEMAEKRAKALVRSMVMGTIAITVMGIVFGVLGFYYLAMLMVVALLPGLLAYMTDVKPGKLASKSIFAMNMAGLFPVVVSIFTGGNPDVAAQAALTDPQTWLLVYGFAFSGWFLIFMIPQVIKLYMDMQADFRVKLKLNEQESLVNEWGEGVKKALAKRDQLVRAIKKRGPATKTASK